MWVSNPMENHDWVIYWKTDAQCARLRWFCLF